MASDYMAGEVLPSGRYGARLSPGMVIARQDRIKVWALPPIFLVVIGVGFLFTFYDIFDINVSFIQTCTQIVAGCTPATASGSLGLPTFLSLVGYVIGALGLTQFADRFGRRDTLLITLLITGLGSLYTALSPNYLNFNISRLITGIGIGADLAIVNTYVGEVAPSAARARYTALIFIMSALGAVLGIWLGLFLTTAPEHFPLGLPFALGTSFSFGWRLMYGIGALLALLGILLRFELPESPRWLVSQGRVDKADAIVRAMEERAARQQVLEPVTTEAAVRQEDRMGYMEIFTNRQYLFRTILLLVMWFLAYITVYAIAIGITTILTSLGYPPPEAGLIAAIGTAGFVVCALFAVYFGERLERKYWLPIMAIVTLIGGIIIAVSPHGGPDQIPWGAFIGSFIIFFGFNGWVPQTYAWSAENYPTRARVTGFGIVDGGGHIGGGIGMLVIAPFVPSIGALPAFVLIAGFMIVAAIIAQFGVATRGKNLEDVSP